LSVVPLFFYWAAETAATTATPNLPLPMFKSQTTGAPTATETAGRRATAGGRAAATGCTSRSASNACADGDRNERGTGDGGQQSDGDEMHIVVANGAVSEVDDAIVATTCGGGLETLAFSCMRGDCGGGVTAVASVA